MVAKMSVSNLKEADLRGKIVFVRVDLNVLLGDDSKITCCTRNRDALPTIKHLMGHGAKVVLSGYLGSRKDVNPKKSLKSLLPRLSELLVTKVQMANDSIGEEVADLLAGTQEGGVLLVENLFSNPEFVKNLASNVDLYVDASGTAHRASTERMIKYLKSTGKKYTLKACCCWLPGAFITLFIGGAADGDADWWCC